MNSDEKVALFDLHNVLVEMVIFPVGEKDPDIVEVKAKLETKTPSERLRNVLFALHQHEKSPEPFSVWYELQMEKFINHIKSKLP